MLGRFSSQAGLLSLLLTQHTCSATLLYVASYAGTVTTLKLSPADGGAAALETVSSDTNCGPQPSWLTLDKANSLLYCVDEAFNGPNGSISSYKVGQNGVLTQLDKLDTIIGPVSLTFYGEGNKGIAAAHYSGSSVSSYSIADPAALALVKAETYTLSAPGPDPDRQEAPHPHEAITDPKGEFLLVPDLGADLVRVYRINGTSLDWEAVDPLVAAPGSGPRHAVFLVAGGKTFFYLIAELANTITGYEVTYNGDATLGFKELFKTGTHGDAGAPAGAAAAEIEISPDHKFLIVSSRGENSFKIPNFDPNNSTEIVSDALISFSIDHASGCLTKVQEFPSGGSFPRHFSLNKAGTQVGVGLQRDGRVVIINRDVQTGNLTSFAANANVAGEVNTVIWDE